MTNLAHLKVAIIHDWLVISGGAERVLEQLIRCFPQAHLYTIVDFLPPEKRDFLQGAPVTPSFIQKLPLAQRYYWYYLPLMPIAIEQFDLSDYDLVISSSHVVAKGVITHPDQLHISYIHSPVRFAWDLQNYYLNAFGYTRGIKSLLSRVLFHYLRLWDYRTANGVDLLITNSHFIARRTQKAYGRDSVVIYPPVDVETFELESEKQDFYLAASFMNPFKKVDLIVEAFAALPEQRLVVIGEGPDFEKIRATAPPNVKFLGYQPTPVLRQYMQQAKAFIFAAPEDFGIIMAEAQACGTPVIAYGRGGANEIVQGLDQPQPTGVLFPQQTVASLVDAIAKFERSQVQIDPTVCRQNALRFTPEQFRQSFTALVEEAWATFQTRLTQPRN